MTASVQRNILLSLISAVFTQPCFSLSLFWYIKCCSIRYMWDCSHTLGLLVPGLNESIVFDFSALSHTIDSINEAFLSFERGGRV